MDSESILGTLDMRRKYTLDGKPVYRKAQPYSHLGVIYSLPRMFLVNIWNSTRTETRAKDRSRVFWSCETGRLVYVTCELNGNLVQHYCFKTHLVQVKFIRSVIRGLWNQVSRTVDMLSWCDSCLEMLKGTIELGTTWKIHSGLAAFHRQGDILYSIKSYEKHKQRHVILKQILMKKKIKYSCIETIQ